MNTKAAAVGAVVVLAIVIGAYIYFNQPEPETDPWAEKNETYIEYFTENLAGAGEIYLVMDLRGADATTQRNIMQCSADLAFSSSLGGKSKAIYSLDEECLRIRELDGDTPVTLALSQCLAEIDAARGDLTKSVFYVRESNKTMIFDNELVIGMNGTYEYMGCSISSESRQPAITVDETMMNETWERLTNATREGPDETGETSS